MRLYINYRWIINWRPWRVVGSGLGRRFSKTLPPSSPHPAQASSRNSQWPTPWLERSKSKNLQDVLVITWFLEPSRNCRCPPLWLRWNQNVQDVLVTTWFIEEYSMTYCVVGVNVRMFNRVLIITSNSNVVIRKFWTYWLNCNLVKLEVPWRTMWR